MNPQQPQSYQSPLTTPQQESGDVASSQLDATTDTTPVPTRPSQAQPSSPHTESMDVHPTPFWEEQQDASPPEQGSSRGLLLGLVVGLVVVLGSVLGAAAWFGVLPFSLDQRDAPEVVIYQAMKKSFGASSVAFEGDLASTMRELNARSGSALGGAADISLAYSGAVQSGALTNSGHVSFETALSVEGVQLSMELDARWIESDLYLRLGRVGVASNPTEAGGDPTSAMAVAMVAGMAQMFQGKWIHLPLDEIVEQLEDELRDAGVEPADAATQLDDIDADVLLAFLEAHYDEFVTLFAIQELPEMTDGARRFELVLNTEQWIRFLSAHLVPFVEEQVGVEQARELSRELDDLRRDVADLPAMTYQLTVGADGYIREIAIPPFTHADDEHLMDIQATLRFFDYNEPVEVSVPDNAMTLEELMMELFGQMFMQDQVPIESFSLNTILEAIPGSSLMARVPLSLPAEWYATVPETVDMRASARDALCAALPRVQWCR